MDIFTDFDAIYTADYYGDIPSEDATTFNDTSKTEIALTNNQTKLAAYVVEERETPGNVEEILKYPDPLKHIQKLKLNAFDITSD